MNYASLLSTKLAIGAALFAVGGAALAQDQSDGADSSEDRPEIYEDLLACRAIDAVEARLACYDQRVDALSKAEEEGTLIVVDTEVVKETRRGLFGFSLPRIGLFGGGDRDDDDERIDEIEARIASARRYSATRWEFRLDNGTVWRQTSAERLYEPDEGTLVTIKRAALGSYKARLQGQGSIRVRRHQ